MAHRRHRRISQTEPGLNTAFEIGLGVQLTEKGMVEFDEQLNELARLDGR